MDRVAPNAVQHKLDGILIFVSDPCCGIIFAEPWMGKVFGLLELVILSLPIIIAFLFGSVMWRFITTFLVLTALLFILVPTMSITLWGCAWLCAALAVYQRRRRRQTLPSRTTSGPTSDASRASHANSS
jgi:predicted membrane metal-binding protein